MAYQEQQTETKRTVVETPNAMREVVHSEAVRYPDRSGLSGGALAAIIVGVIALAAIIVFFVLNRQQDVASQSPPQTTIVQQPAQQPPVIVQQPATQAPLIINNPTSGGPSAGNVPDDSGIRAAIDKKLSNDPSFSSLGIVASVANGKVTLTGTVKTESLKTQAERAVRNVKGVKVIDNQITVG
jgi:hypothetical protein